MEVWKYPIILSRGGNQLEMPKGAKVLTVQAQGEGGCIWALVDPEAPLETRGFTVYGTGHPMPPWASADTYCGTFQMAGGRFIWHVFEGLETEDQ